MTSSGINGVNFCTVGLVIVVVAAGCRPTEAGQPPTPSRPSSVAYADGELIVKLTPQAGQIVEATLRAGLAPAQSGLAWMDALNARYGVTKIEPVFTHQSDIETVRRKYPERSRRAPTGATAPTLQYTYKLTLRADADVTAAAVEYGSTSDVEYAQPNYSATIQSHANRTH